jgi:hypothetical protein
MMTVLNHPTLTFSFNYFYDYKTKQYKYQTHPTFFNIASHNTRSLLDSHKQQLLVDFYSINHLDIIAVQETNFTSPLHHFPLKAICNNKFILSFLQPLTLDAQALVLVFLLRNTSLIIFSIIHPFLIVFSALIFNSETKTNFVLLTFIYHVLMNPFVYKQFVRCVFL